MRALDPQVFDAIWEQVEPLLPAPKDDHRSAVTGLGCPTGSREYRAPLGRLRASNGAAGRSEPGRARPDSDGTRPVTLLSEDVREDRERGGQ